jgi:hypothetical protein
MDGAAMFAPAGQSQSPASEQLAARQLARLEALIGAARAARPSAARGMLFASRSGKALVNAAFDLFECDGLYRLGQDVDHELGHGDGE